MTREEKINLLEEYCQNNRSCKECCLRTMTAGSPSCKFKEMNDAMLHFFCNYVKSSRKRMEQEQPNGPEGDAGEAGATQTKSVSLEDLLKLLPEPHEVVLFYGGFMLKATADAMNCMLIDEVCRADVVNIEASDDMVKVWLENKEHA